MTISERVFATLKQRGKTQVALAEYLGMNKSTVGYWFKNGGGIPSECLMPICQFLGISPNFVLTGIPDPDPEDAPVSDMTEDERELLRVYRQLDREGRTMTLATAYNHRNRVNGAGDESVGSVSA